MRRNAQYCIDDKTLEERELDSPPEEPVAKTTPRVIYKIKRNPPPEAQESKPKFHIKLGSLPQQFSLGTQRPADPLPEPVKPLSLFGNLFSHLAPKSDVSGVTSNPFQTGINLFSQQNSNTPLLSTPGCNIFENKHDTTPKGNSLFQDGDDLSQADSQEAAKKQKMDVDPTKSTAQYKYEEIGSVLASSKLLKYKKDDGDLLTDISMVFAEGTKDKLYYLTARLSATQHIIFSGIVTKNSEVKNIGEASLDIFPFTVEEGKAKRHRLRVQFSDGASREQFAKELVKAIEKEKKQ